MTPHPDFAANPPPRSADLGLFRLTPLCPDVAEEDFAAVSRSAPVLRGLFGTEWAGGLALRDNQVDMAWE